MEFSPLALLVRPREAAPALTGSKAALRTLLLAIAFGMFLVLTAARHATAGGSLRGWDLFFLAALLGPIAGYLLLVLATRVATFVLGAREPPIEPVALARLYVWCLVPVLVVALFTLMPMLAAGTGWFDGAKTPFWGVGALGVAVAALMLTAAAWSVWLMISAGAARFQVSKASALVLVSSTIAVLAIAYALLIVLLVAMLR